MPIITCPHCATKLDGPAGIIGQEVVCGRCKRSFIASTGPAAPQPPRPQQRGGEEFGPTIAPAREAPKPAQEPPAGAEGAGAVPAQPPAGEGLGAPPAPPAGTGGEPPPTPPPPPPRPFGTAQPGAVYGQPQLPPSGQATASLVLGIISLTGLLFSFCCCVGPLISLICGILAIVFARRAGDDIALGLADPAGESRAKAGRICGIIGLTVALLVGAGQLTYILIGVAR